MMLPWLASPRRKMLADVGRERKKRVSPPASSSGWLGLEWKKLEEEKKIKINGGEVRERNTHSGENSFGRNDFSPGRAAPSLVSSSHRTDMIRIPGLERKRPGDRGAGGGGGRG